MNHSTISDIGKVNRESWLRAAYALLRSELLPEAPEVVAVTWGFPSKGGRAVVQRVLGECHYGPHVQGDIEGGKVILISPTIDEPLRILDVLLHEMTHAVVPEAGHRKAFSQLAARVGLQKPWIATTASPALRARLEVLLGKLPPWPGGCIDPHKQGSLDTPRQDDCRQMKATCGCNRILRLSRKVAAEGGILCLRCNTEFELKVAVYTASS